MGRRWAVQFVTAALLLSALLWVRGWPGEAGALARSHVRRALTASVAMGHWGTRQGVLGWISGVFGVRDARPAAGRVAPVARVVRPPVGSVPVSGALEQLFSRAAPYTLWRVSPRAVVRSAWAGTVTSIRPGRPYADSLRVRSRGQLVAQYGGLDPLRVHRGQHIGQGAILGYMAPVGPGVVSRLRFAVQIAGRPRDPLRIGLR